MQTVTGVVISLLAIALTTSCGGDSPDFQPETIIALERAALDRWGKGDPQGYLETYAPEITYFDPTRDKRMDGLDAMKQFLIPLTEKIRVSRYEMIDPKVQRRGDTAVLTYNLISHVQSPDGRPFSVRWNCTEVYTRIGGAWKIIHNHWSYTKPELKTQPDSQL